MPYSAHTMYSVMQRFNSDDFIGTDTRKMRNANIKLYAHSEAASSHNLNSAN